MPSACRIPFVAVPLVVGASVVALAQAPPMPQPQPAAPPPPSAESVKKAEQVLVEARKALGGLDSVKTLVASGRTKRIRGNNLVPIEFEIFFEPPSKYVRADEFPAEDTDPDIRGIQRRRTHPESAATSRSGHAPGGAGGPGCSAAPPGREAGWRATGRRCAGRSTCATWGRGASGRPNAAGGNGPRCGGARRHGAGWTRADDGSAARPVAVSETGLRAARARPVRQLRRAIRSRTRWAALAEAPQGRADVLDVKGEGNFSARLFIHSDTRLPIMVTWTTPPANVIVTVPGQPPPATVAPGAVVVAGPPAPAKDAPKEEMDKYSKEVLAIRAKAQATPVENRLYFADYRDVDGSEAAVQAAARRSARRRPRKRRSIGSRQRQDRSAEVRSDQVSDAAAASW